MEAQRARERTVKQYRRYRTAEGRILAQNALYLLSRGTPEAADEANDILWHLATLVPDALVDIQLELAQRRVFYPGFMFRGASTQVRDELIRRVLTRGLSSLERNHLLQALVWVGDSVVQELFADFRHVPPPWKGDLHASPEEYAPVGGWHLTANDERRDLVCSTCYELVPSVSSVEVDSPVVVIGAHDDPCRWCGLKLVTLLDFDLRTSALSFLALSGERLRVAFCERCSWDGTTYTEIDLHGGSRWSEHNQRPKFSRPDDPYESWPRHSLALGSQRRMPVEANLLAMYGGEGASQIGGYPSWIQDAEHPPCPECRRPMPFIGQVSWDDLADLAEGITYAEGMTYAFVCTECGIAATNFQQT